MSVAKSKVLDRVLGGAALSLLRPMKALEDLAGGYPALRAVREIVAVKFWGIGNAALLLPVLRELKARHPAARLSVVTLKGNEPLFEGVADRTLSVRMAAVHGTLLDLLRVATTLRRRRVDLALDTVQRMLAFYRPDPGDFSRINVQKTIEHILHLMARQFAERGIKVELDSPGNIRDICAVDSQLQQVVINLLLNAFDAMPNGGNLIISLRNQGKGVEIRVKDSGPGVPAGEQSRIFEPFFSSKEGGTGLGLTVSYNIISAHGGTLELISDQTQGACFRVFLPIGEKS